MPISTINPKSLRKAPLFAILNDDELRILAQDAELACYSASALIFREHDLGGAMYIVERGTVELFINDVAASEVRLLKAEAGQVFGEMSVLDDQPRSASARALTEVELIVIHRDALIKAINERPHVALQMLKILSTRLRATSALVQERVVINANEAIGIKRTLGDKISDFFINASASLVFVVFSLVWFVVWIVWNLGIIPGISPFDPFPFGLLTMVVSLEMVFLSLFILIKQARQAADDKVRSDVEYEVNVRAEVGIRNLIRRVETLEQRLVQRLERLEDRELVTGKHVFEREEDTICDT